MDNGRDGQVPIRFELVGRRLVLACEADSQFGAELENGQITGNMISNKNGFCIKKLKPHEYQVQTPLMFGAIRHIQ